MAKLKHAATKLWHWLILLAAVIGAGVSLRFAWFAYETAQAETGSPLVMWGLAGVLVLVALFCLWETGQRIVALRRPPG